MNKLHLIPAELRDRAHADFEAGDVLGAIGWASNTDRLALVVHNMDAIKSHGLYERALLDAFCATRTNHARFPLEALRFFFQLADRERLRAESDPLPGPGPFTVYRGVAGHGRGRRLRGLSWTGSVGCAAWFAHRFEAHLPDPAVVCTTVTASDVLAYLGPSGRDEAEYVLLLAPGHPVQRVRVDTKRLAAERGAEIVASNRGALHELKGGA